MAEQIGAYAYLECSAKTKEVFVCIDSFIERHFFYVRQNSDQFVRKRTADSKAKLVVNTEVWDLESRGLQNNIYVLVIKSINQVFILPDFTLHAIAYIQAGTFGVTSRKLIL